MRRKALLIFPLIALVALAAGPEISRGIQLYRDRQFTAAAQEFRKQLVQNPKNATARLYLARTLLEQNRIPEALGEIERVLAAKPGPEVRFEAGRILRQLAEQRLAALERVAPDSAGVRELAGRRFELLGKLPEALQEYREAAKHGERPGLHYKMGNVLWRMRDLDAAAKELQAELALSPHHGMANLRLGQILLAHEEGEAAAGHLERARAAMPDSLEVRRELGKAYRKSKRTAEARREWEAVAAARPEDDQVHYLLGNLYRELGEAELSKREMDKHRDIIGRRRAAAGGR